VSEMRSAEMQQCIDDCERCHVICLETVAHCLNRGGEHAAPDHITALLDCLDMCVAATTFMLRDSEMHAAVCDVCAAACDACAASCQGFPEDEAMDRCADVCLDCADSCRQMARSAAHA